MRNVGVQGGELLLLLHHVLRSQSSIVSSVGRRFSNNRALAPEKRIPRKHGLRERNLIIPFKRDGRPTIDALSDLPRSTALRTPRFKDFRVKSKASLLRRPPTASGRLSQKPLKRRLTSKPPKHEALDDFGLISYVFQQLAKFSNLLEDDHFLLAVGLQEETKEQIEKQYREFSDELKRKFKGWDSRSPEWKPPSTIELLRQVYLASGPEGIEAQLKFMFQGHNANRGFTKDVIRNQARLADLRYPIEWFPATRTIQRTIHLHVGPTNSGKTYHALKRLEQAKSGIYAGPLRLLAHEVYGRLNAKGISCHLITGDERIVKETETFMSSCTVEMVPLNTDLEVAVVDEIQMIGDKSRGWAWTQAVLGVKAKELHLCGEDRATPLIKELATAMGDKLEIHHYERLSPLRTMSASLNGDLKNLRKGDCLVVFSRVGIHAIKKEIEEQTGKRVAVVYGSLPPDTRAQQAKLFNDPDNDYDILVATDAIGMGLNLSIKRVIFQSILRSKGRAPEVLSVSEIKQIAGRAGRYRTAVEDNKAAQKLDMSQVGYNTASKNGTIVTPNRNLGLVTSFNTADLPVIHRAMQMEADPILTAGVSPPSTILKRFAAYFSSQTPFSYILLRLHEISQTHTRFHLCHLDEQINIADVLQPIKGLTIDDRITICAAPASLRNPGTKEILGAYAKCVAAQTGGDLLDITELNLEILDREHTADKEYLESLEGLHKALVLYLWLSYRFNGIFTSQALAFHVKSLVEQKIDKVLDDFVASGRYQPSHKKSRGQDILRDFLSQIGVTGTKEVIAEPDSLTSTRRHRSLQNFKIRNQKVPGMNQTGKLIESLS